MRAIVLAQGWLVIITGLSGAPQYRVKFDSVATMMATAARTRLGLPIDHVLRLGESTTPSSNAEGIARTLADVAAKAGPRDVIAVVLIGHGSAMEDEPKFNIAGPDLTPGQLRVSLARFPTQEVVIVNTTPASGPWMEGLSGPRRTIITATRSGTERDETVFGRYFAEALASDAGDADKDGRVSLLEAFNYAKQGVERSYQATRHLQTEHPLLDDDGDGRGSLTPGLTGDGRRAALLFLDAPPLAAGDSALAGLFAKRDSLQHVLSDLRAKNDSAAMEPVLLEFARTGAAIRARQGAHP